MPKKKINRRTLEHDIFDKPVINGGIKSKNKGDKNERVACKWLYKWTGKRFIRTPSSGGRRLENNSSFCGDVVCEDETFNFQFAVETKHLEKLRYPRHFADIWEQCERDAVRANKIPMLMLRLNGMAVGSYLIYFDNQKVCGMLALEDVLPIDLNRYPLKGYDSEEVLKVSYGDLFYFQNI